MTQQTVLSAGEITTMMVTALITTFFLISLLLLLIKVIKKEMYKNKLSKIDLKEYVPLGFGKTGLPAIMQHRKDPNKLIFL